MKLTGPDSFFELDILDYEYGNSPSSLDRNWLLISLKTRYKNQEYTTTAPLLSTWEIEQLIKWMQALGTEQALASNLFFTEPCLGFCFSGTDSFAIKLDHEAAPYWIGDDTRPFWLSVNPNQEELKSAITDLKRQLSFFPVRE